MSNDSAQKPAATRFDEISTLPRRSPGVSGTVTAIPILRKDEEKRTRYACYIDDFVDSPDHYNELLHVLYNAVEGDEVEILINSYGGWVESGIAILTAVKYTKARVEAIAYGICASIAAIIWAGCPNRRISKNATIMFHMPSGMFGGKASDMEEETHNMQVYFTKILSNLNRDGLLTEDEIRDIVENRQDFYIPGERIKSAIEL